MPTVTFNLFDAWRENRMQMDDTVDLEYSGTPAGAVLKMMLASSAVFTVNQNTNVTLADITHTEVTGTGYTTGGNACANASISMDAAGLITVDADDPAAWTENGAGFTNARRALLVFDNGGAQSTWPVVGYSADFGADEGNDDQDLQIQFGAGGIFTQAR